MDAQWMRIYIEKTILKIKCMGRLGLGKGCISISFLNFIFFFLMWIKKLNICWQKQIRGNIYPKYVKQVHPFGDLTISLQDPSSASKWNLLKQTHLPAAVTFERLTLGWLASNAIGTWDTQNPGMILELEHHGEKSMFCEFLLISLQLRPIHFTVHKILPPFLFQNVPRHNLCNLFIKVLTPILGATSDVSKNSLALALLKLLLI